MCFICSFQFNRCGFGLLMYGFGSKKALIEDFASTALTDYSVVVINGYLQAINIKQVSFAQTQFEGDKCLLHCLLFILMYLFLDINQ